MCQSKQELVSLGNGKISFQENKLASSIYSGTVQKGESLLLDSNLRSISSSNRFDGLQHLS